MAINEDLTLQEYGYESYDLACFSKRYVIRECDMCGKIDRVQNHHHSFSHCASCAAKHRFLDEQEREKIRAAKIGFHNPMYGMKGESHHNYKRPMSDEQKQKISAAHQGIIYDDWESYSRNNPYCHKFNDDCKESNRDKFGRICFLCGLPESENITSTGRKIKLSVHHIDMNKWQGCDEYDWKLVPLCLHCHGRSHNDEIEFTIQSMLKHRIEAI